MRNRHVSIFKDKKILYTAFLFFFLTTAMIIIAMLFGNEAGSFVIRVQQGDKQHTIAITETNPEELGVKLTSKLTAPSFSNFTDYSPKWFLRNDYETINEYTAKGGLYAHTNHEQAGAGISLYCYTFYIANTSTSNAAVGVNVEMGYSNVTNYLDEIVRVMTYTYNEDGNEMVNIYQKSDENYEPYEWYTMADPKFFESKTQVFNDEQLYINSGEYIKYSVIFWLEGDDPDSEKYGEALYGGTIKFDLTLKVQM